MEGRLLSRTFAFPSGCPLDLQLRKPGLRVLDPWTPSDEAERRLLHFLDSIEA